MVVCNACNALDGRLKVKLNTIKEFSFSPEELKCIIKNVNPNKSIKNKDLDIELALKIYQLAVYTILMMQFTAAMNL
jgi:phage/plasmid primase-like uncharacterized protein